MRVAVFSRCNLDFETGPDIDILKTYLHTEKSCQIKLFKIYTLNKYENSSLGQRSRSNVTNF